MGNQSSEQQTVSHRKGMGRKAKLRKDSRKQIIGVTGCLKGKSDLKIRDQLMWTLFKRIRLAFKLPFWTQVSAF